MAVARRNTAVYLIFAASGCTALVYQVIWARWLGHILGNTTTSVSIVLGSFMLGLALGSFITGRILHLLKNPMRAYAAMELGIGLFAFSFPLLTRLIDLLFSLLVSADSANFYSLSVRAVLVFALLLIPTTFMGATLPLLTDFFRRAPRHTISWKVGLLYAANTFGAALGTVAVGFVLIELLGVLLTMMIAAFLNLMIAGFGYLVSRSTVLDSPSERAAASAPLDSAGRLAVGLLAASGAIALASEVLWTRTMEMRVGNSTYAFATIVLQYLLGIAAGSWVMSLVVNRLRAIEFWLASLLAAMGAWTFVAIHGFGLIVASAPLSGAGQDINAMVPISAILWDYLKTTVIIAPLSLLSGACFPVATRIIDPDSDDARGSLVAKAYAWNTAGAVAGSLVGGFLIAPFSDFFDSLYILGIIYCLTASAAFAVLARAKRIATGRKALAVPLGVACLLLVGFGVLKVSEESYFVKLIRERNPQTKVKFHKPGLQGVTTVITDFVDVPWPEMLLINGKGMTVKVTDTKMMAHLPMILHPDPEDTLIIAFGMGTTHRSAISYGRRVTSVELVAEVYEAFSHFHDDASRVRSYPGGRMIVNDGRNFLKLTEERFDVITVDPPPPIDGAGVSSLYSLEFIDLARQRLKPGGIMAHWIPFPLSRSGVDDWDIFNMLLYTFADVFPYVYVKASWNNVGLHVLGSMEPLAATAASINMHLSKPSVVQDMKEWNNVPAGYFTVEPLERKTETPTLMTDDRPRLEFYLLRTLQGSGMKPPHFQFW